MSEQRMGNPTQVADRASARAVIRRWSERLGCAAPEAFVYAEEMCVTELLAWSAQRRASASLGPYQEAFEDGVRAAAQLSEDEGAESFAHYVREQLLGKRRADAPCPPKAPLSDDGADHEAAIAFARDVLGIDLTPNQREILARRGATILVGWRSGLRTAEQAYATPRTEHPRFGPRHGERWGASSDCDACGWWVCEGAVHTCAGPKWRERRTAYAKTSEGRRAPVVTNDEAKGSGETHPEPLTPPSRSGASEEAGTIDEAFRGVPGPTSMRSVGGATPPGPTTPVADSSRKEEHPLHDWIPFSKRARYETIIEAARRAVEAGPAGIMRDGFGYLREALEALDADWPKDTDSGCDGGPR